MEQFGRWVVARPRLILLVAAISLVPALIGSMVTGVNYDILSYLPRELNSVQGGKILEEEFGQGELVLVMVPLTLPWQVHQLKEQIAQIPGVARARWLDDYISWAIPPEFLPGDTPALYLSETQALLQVRFGAQASFAEVQAGIASLRDAAGPQGRVGGLAAILLDLSQILNRERVLYVLAAVLVMLLLLTLATPRWIEPLAILAAMGFAIIINMGTNAFLGTISYLSLSVAAILQLGVSMDYSIFLIHRYQQEVEGGLTAPQAMARAVAGTGIAIASSAFTTIAGFLALLIMKFGLGGDLGLVMAKGVLCSLLSVLLVLPALLLVLPGGREHRTWVPGFGPLACWIRKMRLPLLAVFLLLLLPALKAQTQAEIFYNLSDGLSPQVRGVADLAAIRQEFGSADVVNLLIPTTDIYREYRLLTQLNGLSGVRKAVGLASLTNPLAPYEFADPVVRETFHSQGWSLVQIILDYPQGSPEANSTLAEVEGAAAAQYQELYLFGEAVLTRDLMSFTARDLQWVSILSMAAVAIIIGASFRSFSLPLLLVLPIVFAVGLNIGIANLLGQRFYFVTYLVLGAIQLGTTVDYAILLAGNYRQARATLPPQEAAQEAVVLSGGSILTSALTFLGATAAVSLLSQITMVSQLCGVIGRGALISMLVILLFLPGLLVAAEPIIQRTTRLWPKY